jgi:hypothetical protein
MTDIPTWTYPEEYRFHGVILMTRAKTIAMRIRWVLLVLWVACVICAIVWLFAPLFNDSFGIGLTGTPALFILGPAYQLFEDYTGKWIYILLVLIYLALLFLTQWWFLSPRHIWKIKLTEKPRPMKRAAISAALAATLLSIGVSFSIVDLIKQDFFTELEDPSALWHYLVLLIPVAVWVVWSVIFIVYLRQGDHYNRAGKIIRGLIAGSVLELFVAVPVYATRQDDCYCARGSYAGLVFGGTVLLWAFGPAIFLLFIREKQRREQLIPQN